MSRSSRDDDAVPSNLDPSFKCSAHLPEMTMQDLRILISSFKLNKAPGADNIRLCDLRRNFDTLGNALLYIFNGIIKSEVIPDRLKAAIVRPLYKGGKRNDVASYRPISILPCLALILQKTFTKNNDLISR